MSALLLSNINAGCQLHECEKDSLSFGHVVPGAAFTLPIYIGDSRPVRCTHRRRAACLQAPLLEALDKETPPLSAAAPVADAHLGQYRAPLQRVAIAKMLHQLSQVQARTLITTSMVQRKRGRLGAEW